MTISKAIDSSTHRRDMPRMALMSAQHVLIWPPETYPGLACGRHESERE